MKRRLVGLLIVFGLLASLFALTTVPAFASRCGPGGYHLVGQHYAQASDGRNPVWVEIDLYQEYAWDQGYKCYDYVIYTYAYPPQSVYSNPLNLRVWECGSRVWGIPSSSTGWDVSFESGWIEYPANCGAQADDYLSAIKTSGGTHYASPYVSW